MKLFARFKYQLLITLAAIAFTLPIALPVTTFACDNIQTAIGSGINGATGDDSSCSSTGSGITYGIKQLSAKVVNIFSVVVGAVAVLMILYGGFKYITSGGDSGNVSGAKNTLIYAIVGLFIVAVAQLIVHYILNTAASVTGY